VATTIQQQPETVVPQPKSREWMGSLCWLGIVAIMAGLGAYHWFIYVPQADIPHALTILDFLFCVGIAAGIVFLGVLVGLRILRPFRIAAQLSRIELAALAAGIGLGALSLATLILGMLHLYYTVTFAVLLAFVPLLFPTERRWMVQLLTDLPSAVRRFARGGPTLFDTVTSYICMAIAVSTLLLAYVRDLTLPGATGYDTYQYHWAVPVLLLRVHAWQGFPGWAHANLPFDTEMLNTIALSLRAPTAASFVQDTFGLLFALLVFALLRRHFGRSVAWMAVAALATVPLLLAYASQSYVETALMFYGFASLTLLLFWLEHGPSSGRTSIEALALAGVMLGFAIDVKYTAVEYLPGILLLLAGGSVVILRRARRASPRSAALLPAIAGVLVFGLSLALVYMPWLLKDWIYLGNPVYPALANIFGAPVWNATRDQTLIATFQHFGPHTGLIAHLHLYALDLFFHPDRYGEGIAFPTGDLALAALLVIPTLALALRRGRLGWSERVRGQVLVLVGLSLECALGLLVWNQSGALVERYALPIVVLTTVLGATLLGWLARALTTVVRAPTVSRTWRPVQLCSWLLLLVVVVLCVRQERTYIYADAHTERSPLPLLTGAVSATQYSITYNGGQKPPDFVHMANYINTTLPHTGKLLMLGRGTGYFFTNRDYVADSGGDWVPYLVSAGKTPAGILDILHSQGFTYVVYDAKLMRFLVHNYKNYVLAADLPIYLAFQQQHLTFIAEWGNLSLYRVPTGLVQQRSLDVRG
jgi:hypothetical protein